MLQSRFSYGIYIKAYLIESLMIQMIPAIKNKSRFFHLIKHFLVVQFLV